MGDVDADPLAVEPLGHGDGRAATAERIEHHVALVAACLDDPFEQGFGLLRGVTQSLGARPS